jgi:hypothetical protein
MSSSGKIAFALCAGLGGGGLIGLQVQAYLIQQQRQKEAAFVTGEVQRKVEERKRQAQHGEI